MKRGTRITIILVAIAIYAITVANCQPLSKRYDRYFRRYAVIHGISARWAKAVAISESALNPSAVSWVGARGIMQFMPGTWEWMAPSYYRALGPNNPKAAIWVGCKYLRWNLDRVVPPADISDGERLASASYNSGWGNIRKARASCKDFGGGDPQICDRNVWYGNVALRLVTGRASKKETRTYVERIDRWKGRSLF